MSERPTPDEIEQMLEDQHDGGFTSSPSISDFVNELWEYGYRIVHPDDVPVGDWIDWSADRNHGWDLCRSHIFGPEKAT